ncbi:hypothetical protein [Haladaptatus sp. CMAA 1911]|uniref:hypothetical protein n=1 Tax=unclassified Haladaptatus TaxID=2622732 RepID=UPI003754A79E
MSNIHIADSGMFIALGQPTNSRYQHVRAFVRKNDIVFLLPERVYEEIAGTTGETKRPLIETAIEEGWAQIADPLDYTISVVSQAMDGVQRYIANADDRPADEVERADAALAALAAQHLSTGAASQAYIYTTDIAAGEGAETVLASYGYGDAVTFVNAFRFIESLLN